MHHWLESSHSTAWWICPCKHPPGLSWKWMSTRKAIQNCTVELTAGGEFKTFALYANLDITMYFHVNSVSLLESQTDLGAIHTYIRHASAKQAALCDWQSPFLPVYVALHLFAPSLGYFSRRGLVCRSACVPRIQMKAAVCKVSVRGESVKGSSFSVWHTKVWLM